MRVNDEIMLHSLLQSLIELLGFGNIRIDTVDEEEGTEEEEEDLNYLIEDNSNNYNEENEDIEDDFTRIPKT